MRAAKLIAIGLTLLICGGLSCSAGAADAAGNYAIWGVGQSSCHQFTKSIAKGDTSAYDNYLMGYLTAFNTLSENTYNISGKTKLSEITEWIEGYCDLHQIESFNRAIQQYVSQQFENRTTVSPGSSQGWGGKSAK
ncbi:MAG: hypothetical protein ACU84Q_15330 [Gammaproteobacteria bacterium]